LLWHSDWGELKLASELGMLFGPLVSVGELRIKINWRTRKAKTKFRKAILFKILTK
jgi:hypothetical protein